MPLQQQVHKNPGGAGRMHTVHFRAARRLSGRANRGSMLSNGEDVMAQKQKRERFDYEKMKAAATHDDPALRKSAFIAYFERFAEFPTYLFDEQSGIDERLQKTINDIRDDKEVSDRVLAGIDALVRRLSS